MKKMICLSLLFLVNFIGAVYQPKEPQTGWLTSRIERAQNAWKEGNQREWYDMLPDFNTTITQKAKDKLGIKDRFLLRNLETINNLSIKVTNTMKLSRAVSKDVARREYAGIINDLNTMIKSLEKAKFFISGKKEAQYLLIFIADALKDIAENVQKML